MEKGPRLQNSSRDIPETLPGLLRVLAAKGQLAEFFRQGNEQMDRFNAIEDPTELADELAKFVQKFANTKDETE